MRGDVAYGPTTVAIALAVACGGGGGVLPDDTGVTQAPAIQVKTLLEATRVLASDEFEGRAPGSVGEEKTVAYLTEQFSNLGLTPGNPDGTWVQAVPLVGITPEEGDVFEVSGERNSQTWHPGDDYVAWTKHVADFVEIDAEFVFVGYGAVAPEYAWDDFGDVDVTGKILLFLVNDPPLDDVFGGSAMTYYGRWTYKHEIAAAKGAVGSFVIHETETAGYPWEVVGSSPYVESFDLVTQLRAGSSGRRPTRCSRWPGMILRMPNNKRLLVRFDQCRSVCLVRPGSATHSGRSTHETSWRSCLALTQRMS